MNGPGMSAEFEEAVEATHAYYRRAISQVARPLLAAQRAAQRLDAFGGTPDEAMALEVQAQIYGAATLTTDDGTQRSTVEDLWELHRLSVEARLRSIELHDDRSELWTLGKLAASHMFAGEYDRAREVAEKFRSFEPKSEAHSQYQWWQQAWLDQMIPHWENGGLHHNFTAGAAPALGGAEGPGVA